MKNVFLLPTDKPSRLIKNSRDILRVTDNFTQIDLDFIQAKFVNFYITSDEVIKEGDYFFNRNFTEVHKCIEIDSNGDLLYNRINRIVSKHAKKIILTTEIDLINDGVQRIDEEFLEWFVKNPSCEKVLIDTFVSRIKALDFRKTYTTIIPKKEQPKQGIDIQEFEQKANEIIANVKRMYSEEEVLGFLQEMNDLETRLEGMIYIKKWFEQLKNKQRWN